MNRTLEIAPSEEKQQLAEAVYAVCLKPTMSLTQVKRPLNKPNNMISGAYMRFRRQELNLKEEEVKV